MVFAQEQKPFSVFSFVSRSPVKPSSSVLLTIRCWWIDLICVKNSGQRWPSRAERGLGLPRTKDRQLPPTKPGQHVRPLLLRSLLGWQAGREGDQPGEKTYLDRSGSSRRRVSPLAIVCSILFFESSSSKPGSETARSPSPGREWKVRLKAAIFYWGWFFNGHWNEAFARKEEQKEIG